ncbi:chromate efflux transporter [Oscillatoria amoena NRMC-F 0135]|nr:chromate efflux transporter [Oscillatoria amoena NRMC-F 0135]
MAETGIHQFWRPAGQIAIMHRELVEKKKWIGESRFLNALNYCMLLPGPEAQQLAVYIGWILHRWWGGVIAGLFFFLPAAVFLWILSVLYVTHGQSESMQSVLHGLKAGVLAIIVGAVIKISQKALRGKAPWAVCLVSFAALFFLNVPYPIILIVVALSGLFLPEFFKLPSAHGSPHTSSPAETRPIDRAHIVQSFKVGAICLAVWFLPVILAGVWLGRESVIYQEGIFFSKAAMVTFGGAYAVLPYVEQQTIAQFGWLAPDQMLHGLALSQTIPGPLVMVLQFIGFVSAWNHPGPLSPLAAATLGSFITTWVTFVPSYLWIFLGAPYIERLQNHKKISGAMSAITAAVAGVILSLALKFMIPTFFPLETGIDWFAIVLCAAAFTALQKFQAPVLPVLLACGLLGWLFGIF